jgi:hypothetical protein
MRYCARTFTAPEIERIRALIAAEPAPSRYRLSWQVCEELSWRRPDGKLKDMSCRVALLRMQADGLITLPAPRCAKPVGFKAHPHIEQAVLEPLLPPVLDSAALSIEPVENKNDSLLWNAYIERHHYLGHQLIPGAQRRYFVRTEGLVVALLSFGASAWKSKPRDDYIGWSRAQRERNLHLIVNNARFLILPWIRRYNLASRVLALVRRHLPDDWQRHYGYRPVLMETFVEKPRFTGACYKAANWQYLGDTQGRGKLDRFHHHAKPIKAIWVHPLQHDFRISLCTG